MWGLPVAGGPHFLVHRMKLGNEAMRFLEGHRSIVMAIVITAMASSAVNAAPPPQQGSEKPSVQRGKAASSQKDKAAADAAQQTAPGQLKIGSVQDLCRIREREILFHASMIIGQTTKYLKETDQDRKAALLTEMNATKALATDVESSWQRLNCVTLLYGSLALGGGR